MPTFHEQNGAVAPLSHPLSSPLHDFAQARCLANIQEHVLGHISKSWESPVTGFQKLGKGL